MDEGGSKQIVVVGSHVQGLFMRVDRFPSADETVLGWGFREALDGGKGSHQAIACSRLGARTSFVGCLGTDRLGDRGVEWMRQAGVDLTHLVRSGVSPTGVGFVMINPQGVPAITSDLGANAELGEAHVDDAGPMIAASQIMLVTFEIPIPIALYATRLGHRHGLITILTPGPAHLLDPNDLRAVDILVPNETELKVLTGVPADQPADVETLARRAQFRYGVSRIVVTRGEQGASVLDEQTWYHIPAIPVEVQDTPGAGDAFTAGMAVALLKGCSLRDAVRFGCVCGAYAVTIRESIPAFPTLSQIQSFATERDLPIPAGGCVRNPG